jgi:hypothetical protein
VCWWCYIGGQSKKCRKVITLEQKFDVLMWCENNEKNMTLSMLQAETKQRFIPSMQMLTELGQVMLVLLL